MVIKLGDLIRIEITKSNGEMVSTVAAEYVLRHECHRAHEEQKIYLDTKFATMNQTILAGLGAVNTRIDDVLKSVDNYLKLLKP